MTKLTLVLAALALMMSGCAGGAATTALTARDQENLRLIIRQEVTAALSARYSACVEIQK